MFWKNKFIRTFDMLIILVFPMLFYELGLANEFEKKPIVSTKYGQLEGEYHHVPGVGATVARFLGVPYATSPIGSNRFSPTRTLSHWVGIHKATSFGPSCPQRLPNLNNLTEALTTMSLSRVRTLRRFLPQLREQSEDCLFLNLYVPQPGKYHFTLDCLIFY